MIEMNEVAIMILLWIIVSIMFFICSIFVHSSQGEKERSDMEQMEYLRKWRKEKEDGINKRKSD